MPIYLLAIFGTNERANVSLGELKQLVKLAKLLKRDRRRA